MIVVWRRSLAELDTLPADIFNLLDPETDHIVNEDNLSEFAELCKSLVRDALVKAEQGNPLRFSALGKPNRQMWYEAHPDGTAEKMSGQNILKFTYGHLIEALIILLAKESGHTVEAQQETVEVDGVLGHMDCIIDGILVDVKSASPYGYKKFEDGSILTGSDSFGYIEQLSGYASVRTPGQKAAWVAVEKVSGDICVTYLPLEIINKNKPEPRIKELKNVIDLDGPPDRCYDPVAEGKSGNMRLSTSCSYCSHKHRCYPKIRTFLYSSGPKFLTKVVKEPNVFEI